MPRLKPPPMKPDPVLEDNTPPTEPIEIELADDSPGPTEVELAPAPKPAPPPPAPVEPENPLAAQVDAQRRAEELQRQLAEVQRQNAEHEARLAQEKTRGDDAEYNSVLTAIAAEQAVLDKAEQDWAGYQSVGDFANAAKALRIMNMASSRLTSLEDGKTTMDQAREARGKEPPKPAPTTAPQQMGFEDRIAQMPDTAKTWLRKHPEFINDTAMNNRIGAAHAYLTTNKGIEPFSAAYFDALDQEFGFKNAPEPQPQRRSMPVTAPVSREVPNSNGQKPSSSRVTLTEEERLIARTSFTATDMTNAQKEYLYAQNKQKLAQRRANGSYPQPERN